MYGSDSTSVGAIGDFDDLRHAATGALLEARYLRFEDTVLIFYEGVGDTQCGLDGNGMGVRAVRPALPSSYYTAISRFMAVTAVWDLNFSARYRFCLVSTPPCSLMPTFIPGLSSRTLLAQISNPARRSTACYTVPWMQRKNGTRINASRISSEFVEPGSSFSTTRKRNEQAWRFEECKWISLDLWRRLRRRYSFFREKSPALFLPFPLANFISQLLGRQQPKCIQEASLFFCAFRHLEIKMNPPTALNRQNSVEKAKRRHTEFYWPSPVQWR
ncbi:hypothetical protein B0H12DRAFT_1075042 [Mycena haematopus]|nr:hypothetical protein B0H12DRAFT_1075042 [Mycena haematopus]